MPEMGNKLSAEEEILKDSLSQMSVERVKEIKSTTVEFMLKSKAVSRNEEFVLILFKLCIEINADMLNKFEFFTNLPIKYCVINVKVLNDAKRYHSVALINYLANEFEGAFEIWKRYN
jgi:hypothetical protein